jgi:hypothetical protein
LVLAGGEGASRLFHGGRGSKYVRNVENAIDAAFFAGA